MVNGAYYNSQNELFLIFQDSVVCSLKKGDQLLAAMKTLNNTFQDIYPKGIFEQKTDIFQLLFETQINWYFRIF